MYLCYFYYFLHLWISLFLTLFGVILNLTIATLPCPILHCCLASLINPSFIEEPELSGASRSGTSPPSTCSLAAKPVQKGRHLEVGRSNKTPGLDFDHFSFPREYSPYMNRDAKKLIFQYQMSLRKCLCHPTNPISKGNWKIPGLGFNFPKMWRKLRHNLLYWVLFLLFHIYFDPTGSEIISSHLSRVKNWTKYK